MQDGPEPVMNNVMFNRYADDAKQLAQIHQALQESPHAVTWPAA
jgi:hypothetical protein